MRLRSLRQEVAAVIPEMLWIIGFYVAAAAWVHASFGRNADAGARKRHYVLVAGNHQLQMEWYVLTLQHFSRRTGTDIGITVLLDHSSDDTGPIVELFARGNDGIELIRSSSGEAGAGDGLGKFGEIDKTADRRERMMQLLESTGSVVSPGQVVWVDLGNEDELRKLPL